MSGSKEREGLANRAVPGQNALAFRSARATRAFTLIELLVIVAIIALLAGVLLPVLVSARQRACTANCTSNLHQIGIALCLYAGEQGGYPLATSGDGLGACQRALDGLVNTQVFCCPKLEKSSPQLLLSFPSNQMIFPTYGYNIMGTTYKNPPAVNLGLGGDYIQNDQGGMYVQTPESRVMDPSQMIALGDCPAILPVPPSLASAITPGQLLWISSPNIFPLYGAPGVGQWHNGGANMVFCDGHGEFAKQSVWMVANDGRRRLWNNDNQPHEETWE